MAIYQFQFYLIPKLALYNKYGKLPSQLFIDHESWNKYFKECKSNGDNIFEDALTIPWWSDLKISQLEFSEFAKKILPSYVLNNGLESFEDVDSNSISIGFNEEDNFIEEVSGRIDLRESNNSFIADIVLLAQHFNCLIMDRKGGLYHPTLSGLIESIKLSNSHRFITDPETFLNDLQSKIIKPE